jgi:hypothetical protein
MRYKPQCEDHFPEISFNRLKEKDSPKLKMGIIRLLHAGAAGLSSFFAFI